MSVSLSRRELLCSVEVGLQDGRFCLTSSVETYPQDYETSYLPITMTCQALRLLSGQTRNSSIARILTWHISDVALERLRQQANSDPLRPTPQL